MERSTHQLAGVTAALALINHGVSTGAELEVAAGGAFIIGSSLGALWPDFDTPNSRIGHKLWFLFLPLWLFHGLLSVLSHIPGPQRKLVSSGARLTGHRGLAHYPITWIILYGILCTTGYIAVLLNIPLAAVLVQGTAIGVASHIAGDTIFGGVALLFPIYEKRIKLSPFKTGGIVEKLTRLVLLVLLIKLGQQIIPTLWEQLQNHLWQ